MLTVNRRPGVPHDIRTAVLIDLPHAADKPALAHLASLVAADTHEPVPNVLGLSLHFDINAQPSIWAVAEQFVDEQGGPLPIGGDVHPDHHPEYFGGTLRTALFRYEVAGFTTGPAMNRAAKWHPSLGNIDDEATNEAKHADGIRVFEVSFNDHSKPERVTAGLFSHGDGFVTFFGTPGLPMEQVAAFSVERVACVRTVPDKTVLTLDAEQLRTLRSAVLWDLERIDADPHTSEYRAPLHHLAVEVLGMVLPERQPANDCAGPNGACCEQPDDALGPTNAARSLMGLDPLVERR